MTTSAIGGSGAAGSSRAELAMWAAVAASVLLIPIELGWVAALQYAWGFTLWEYLPGAGCVVLTGLVLLFCWRAPREIALRVLRASHGALERPSSWPLRWAAVAVVPALLWMLREREFLGDSKIILYATATSDAAFHFPDIGATYLLQQGFNLGQLLGVGGLNGVQALVCATAALAVLCFAKLGGYLAPSRRRAAFGATLILCGGVMRIFAGHIEVYSFVVVCLGVYLCYAFAYLEGRRNWFALSLAAGVGIWIHLSFLFLLPSLLLLPLLVETRPRGELVKQWTLGLVIAAAPIISFFVFMWLGGHASDVEKAWAKLLRWSVVGPTPGGHEAWIRPWGKDGAGTRYALFSWRHLKYLANSFFILAPAIVPVVATFALISPRRLVSTPQTAFLSCACATLILYAIIVRPVMGPYDWDLFSITAVSLGALAAHLLTQDLESRPLAQLSILLVAVTLLFVTIPFLIVGIHPGTHRGPFAVDALTGAENGSWETTFEQHLAPWL